MAEEIIEKELSYEIMNAAFTVHNELGPGFLESIYEAALVCELMTRGYRVETQVRVPIFYRGEKIGEHVLDLLVNEKIILELKAVTEIAQIHKQQAQSYVKATNLPLAIVINFGSSRVQSERVANTRNKKETFAKFVPSRHSR